MERQTRKVSAVVISVGEQTRVYRSVSEVPPDLRRKLVETTASTNSATVLIADERGRQEIMRLLRGVPSALESRLVRSLTARRKGNQPAAGTGWRQWVEIGLLGGIGLCLWLLASWK